jgi:hypothetical protein
MSLNYKLFFLLFLLIVNTPRIEAQVMVRLLEAEFSAFANVANLLLIIEAEKKVNKKIKKLNSEQKIKSGLYYNFVTVGAALPIERTIENIRDKLKVLGRINISIPPPFNWKKGTKTRKMKMYENYLKSLEDDVGDDFSNNGNLLKTRLEIIAELEEVEKDIDNTLQNLGVLERVSNMFNR